MAFLTEMSNLSPPIIYPPPSILLKRPADLGGAFLMARTRLASILRVRTQRRAPPAQCRRGPVPWPAARTAPSQRTRRSTILESWRRLRTSSETSA